MSIQLHVSESVELAAFTNEEKRQRRQSVGACELRNRWSSRKQPPLVLMLSGRLIGVDHNY